jgi:hypothetical protein
MKPRLSFRHWLVSYLGGLAAGAAVWLGTANLWAAVGAMVGVVVVYIFFLAGRLDPRPAAATTAPATRQGRRRAERLAQKRAR